MRKYARKPRRRVRRVRRARRVGPRSLGGFTILRKSPPTYLTNTATAGIPNISVNAGTQQFYIGTPEPHPVLTNVYSVPFSCEFSVDQLVSNSELLTIADQYRINKVWIKCIWNTQAIGGPVGTGGYASVTPQLLWIQDYDDSSVNTTLQLRQKMGLRLKSLSPNRFTTITVSPKVAKQAYDGLTTTSAYVVDKGKQWVNSSYGSVPHYGIKGFVQNLDLNTLNAVTSCLTFEVMMSVSLRHLQ